MGKPHTFKSSNSFSPRSGSFSFSVSLWVYVHVNVWTSVCLPPLYCPCTIAQRLHFFAWSIFLPMERLLVLHQLWLLDCSQVATHSNKVMKPWCKLFFSNRFWHTGIDLLFQSTDVLHQQNDFKSHNKTFFLNQSIITLEVLRHSDRFLPHLQ